jgi:hypothetical protein
MVGARRVVAADADMSLCLAPRMKTWMTDMRDLPPVDQPGLPAAAVHRSAFVRELVEAATSRPIGGPWCSAVRCIARNGRKACGARVHVGQGETGRIEWSCATCGESGVITGFEGTEVDLSAHVLRKKKARVWGFDDESRGVLLAATTHIAALRAVIARACPVDSVPGLLVVNGTVEEFDEIYTLVEHLSDATRSRRRLDLLDGLRASLCTAIDGF